MVEEAMQVGTKFEGGKLAARGSHGEVSECGRIATYRGCGSHGELAVYENNKIIIIIWERI